MLTVYTIIYEKQQAMLTQWIDDSFYFKKDSVIKYLEEQGYEHICDDKYQSENVIAEIIGLDESWEEQHG